MTHRKRWLTAMAVLLVLMAGGYYFASPWMMLARLKADAQARNIASMENHIDFPAVRASIKAQIQARLMARMGGHTEDGVTALGMALANAVIDPVVVAVASPQGMVAAMNGENPLPGLNRLDIAVPQPQTPMRTEPAQQQAQTPPASSRRQWRLSYVGPNQVVVRAIPAQEGDPYLVMRRQGLFAWKVTDLQLGRLFWRKRRLLPQLARHPCRCGSGNRTPIAPPWRPRPWR